GLTPAQGQVLYDRLLGETHHARTAGKIERFAFVMSRQESYGQPIEIAVSRHPSGGWLVKVFDPLCRNTWAVDTLAGASWIVRTLARALRRHGLLVTHRD